MPKKKFTSQIIETEKDKKEREILKYDDEEKEQALRIRQAMDQSYTWMNTPLNEFDGESLISACSQNRLIRNSFLTPILNDGEVRVVTGTAEGKADSVFNAVFNQNLECNVRVFDEFDIEDYRLGDTLTKTIKRTRQIERDDDFNESMLREIESMPAVFVQETMSDEWFYDRVLESGEWDDLWQFKIPTFKDVGWMRRREAKKVLWTAEQVFLADPKIPMRLFATQPYYITYATRGWEHIQRVYKNSPRLKYVHPGAAQHEQYKAIVEDSEWRFSRGIKGGEVEEIVYKSVQGDELQVYLNGVPMLPVGCPLITTRMKMPDMTMEGGKEIHPKFAYRRPLISMVKVLQALKDENFRLLILRHQQDIWKPIVTKAKQILSKDMWLPSAVTYGVDKSEIEVLTEGNAKDAQVDIALNKMVEDEISKFINVSALFQGQTEGKMTAREAAQRMKQALIGLGDTLTGYIRAFRNCTYLRLYNVMQNMTKPIDTRYNDYLKKSEDVHRTFTINEQDLYDGKVGTEIVSFVNRALLKQEKDKIIELEKKSRELGRPVSYSFLNVEKLLKTKYLFYVEVEITEKRTSALEVEMAKKDIIDTVDFAEKLQVGVNAEYATGEWAKRVPKIDGRKMFVIPPTSQMGPPQMPGAPEQPGAGGPSGEQGGGAPSQPKPGAPNPGVKSPKTVKTSKTPTIGMKQLMTADQPRNGAA